MSDDSHGHGAGHGHDSHDGPSDIIAPGSWQDQFLAIISLVALAGLCYWGAGYYQGGGITVPQAHEHQAHSAGHAAEHAQTGEQIPVVEHAPSTEQAPATGGVEHKDEHGAELGNKVPATGTNPEAPVHDAGAPDDASSSSENKTGETAPTTEPAAETAPSGH